MSLTLILREKSTKVPGRVDGNPEIIFAALGRISQPDGQLSLVFLSSSIWMLFPMLYLQLR